MTALLALASALIVGGSDFAGGMAARRDSAFRVTAVAQLVGGATAVLLTVVVGWDRVTTADVVAGALAGLSGAFSFVCFYRALAIGTMSIVAPTTAVVGATLPATVGIVRGESIGPLTAVGLVMAVLAIVAVSWEPGDGGGGANRQALVLAVVTGVGFSIFFITLAETHDEAGLWPLVVARLVSVPIVVVVARRVTGRALPEDRRAGVGAAYTGVTEMVANTILLVALRRGELAIASVFGSLYPVSTVVLAWIVLRERLRGIRLLGVGAALVAVVLVAV